MSSSTHPRDGNGKPFSASLSSSNGASSKKTSFNLQSSKRNHPIDSPAPGSRSLPRRPHKLDHGGDSSDEDDSAPVHEEISGFDTHTGGVLAADGQAVRKDNELLIIPVISKNNWRDRPGVNTKKIKKNLLPREVQAMQEAERNGQVPGGSGGAVVETEGPSMAFGLSFAAQKPAEGGGAGDPAVEDQAMPDAKPILPPPIEESKPLTDDQKALQALISESKGEAPERRTDLVIESQQKAQEEEEDDDDEEEEEHGRYDEASSFRTDVASRPESATLDAYDAIPVEQFGAALLRGMGWKDGQAIGRGQYGTSATADRDRAGKPRVPERRPGFLGIGAKDASGGKGAEAELGAWGKSAMRKASRKQGESDGGNTEGVYMPVMMRNRKTGEHITEEELAAMQKEAKSKPTTEDDWRDRRDRNLEKSGRDKDRDREYRRRDYDDEHEERHGRRNGSSRRDRSLSSGRQSSSRRSRYDDDGGREERSRRDRDRRRDRDDDRDRRRDSGRDRDRERERDRDTDRSHRHGDDRASKSRRDRDRDRDRDHDSRRSRRDD